MSIDEAIRALVRDEVRAQLAELNDDLAPVTSEAGSPIEFQADDDPAKRADRILAARAARRNSSIGRSV